MLSRLAVRTVVSRTFWARPLHTNTVAYSDDQNKAEEAKAKLHDLLNQMKNTNSRTVSSSDSETKSTKNDKNIELAKPKKKQRQTSAKGVDPDLVAAAQEVATHLSPANDEVAVGKTKSELLSKLRSVAKETDKAKEEGVVAAENVKSLYGSLKVERSERVAPKGERRATAKIAPLTQEQIEFLEKRRQMRRSAKERPEEQLEPRRGRDFVGFKNAQSLGIFPAATADSASPGETDAVLKTWARCQERELRILSTPFPRNFLEEMAQMTDKGMLWHFPIDNEQGIDKEKLEPFHSHVFLERHLEPWCPKRGPVRDFMELVCVGLQKNPYISVEKKVGHITWFKDYFGSQEKQEVLSLCGAIES